MIYFFFVTEDRFSDYLKELKIGETTDPVFVPGAQDVGDIAIVGSALRVTDVGHEGFVEREQTGKFDHLILATGAPAVAASAVVA